MTAAPDKSLALRIAAMLPPARDEAEQIIGLVRDLVDWAYPAEVEAVDGSAATSEARFADRIAPIATAAKALELALGSPGFTVADDVYADAKNAAVELAERVVNGLVEVRNALDSNQFPPGGEP